MDDATLRFLTKEVQEGRGPSKEEQLWRKTVVLDLKGINQSVDVNFVLAVLAVFIALAALTISIVK